MHTTLKAFLAASHGNSLDQLAQRAINAHRTLIGQSGYIRSADLRGDGEAYAASSRAHLAASGTFYIVNHAKNYPFAAEVLAEMPQLAILGGLDNEQELEETATQILAEAEGVIATYKERCAPTYSMSPVPGVAILRGDRAAHALKGVVVANSNERQH